MSSEIERLRCDVSLSETARQFGVDLRKDGDEFIACCPFHQEDTPSFTVFRGKDRVERMHCFGCDAKGDVVDFTMAIKRVDVHEAIRILGGGVAGPNIQPKQIEARDVYADIVPLDTAGKLKPGKVVKLYNPKRAGTERAWGSFAPSMVHPYRGAGGKLLGYVLRHDLPDGGKETPMVMWVRLPDGTECWSRFPFPKPRPLYGLCDFGDRTVIVVEGEKCADKLAALTKRTVVSWAGGTQGVKHTDWAPLAGRKVVIWPDADAPGLATANEIAKILTGLGCSFVRVCDPGADRAKGWDCADAIVEGWTAKQCDDFMRGAQQWVAPAEPIEEKAVAAPKSKTAVAKQSQQVTTAILDSIPAKPGESWQTELVLDKNNKPKPAAFRNWMLFVENHDHMAGVFALDAFKQKIMLLRAPPWEKRKASNWTPRELVDNDYTETAMWLERIPFANGIAEMTPKPSSVTSVVHSVAEHARFDSLMDYLNGLKWDGTVRVDHPDRPWLTYYMGAKDDEATRAIGLRWLISAVARGLDPGCKVDTMPILEGPQGKRKSAVVRALYGSAFYSDALSHLDSKDAKMEVQGVWGMEAAEMSQFSASKIGEIKKFLTQREDRFRPPYGKTVLTMPRRVILNGTINPEGNAYLHDPTGARRFWPIAVGNLDVDGVAADRDQLWAEAVHYYRLKMKWWMKDEEEDAVLAEQEMRTGSDPWTDLIEPILDKKRTITRAEIIKELKLSTSQINSVSTQRIGRVMMKQGWERGKVDGVFNKIAEPEMEF